METKTHTLELNVVLLAKKLAIVTLLGLVGFQAKAAVRPTNLNAVQAQTIVNQVYDRVQRSGEVAGYEVFAPHDRIEHPCSSECACLSKKFTKALNQSGFTTKTVLVRPARNSAGLKLRGAQPQYGILKEASFNYHVVTIVRLIGGWRVVDPIALQSARLEPFKVWQRRIETPVEMSVR
jgi:hypothetical protein